MIVANLVELKAAPGVLGTVVRIGLGEVDGEPFGYVHFPHGEHIGRFSEFRVVWADAEHRNLVRANAVAWAHEFLRHARHHRLNGWPTLAARSLAAAGEMRARAAEAGPRVR